MFDPIFQALGAVLAFFYSIVPDLGVAIMLLTGLVMLVLFPLTQKQAKSMMAMQRVQPEIKKLQAKYKGDRQKLNEEMMKFYQENKINPLAGCLPLVVQLPVFFILFRVLRDSYKHVPTSSKLYDALCNGFGKLHSDGTWGKCGATITKSLLRQYPVSGAKVGDPLVHHLGFLSKNFLDLRLNALDHHPGGFIHAVPYFALVLLVMATGFAQSRQAQRRTPQANKQMAAVMKILPIFFGMISLSFPSGLVLYFFVSNLWRLGQQEIIFRRHGSALHGPGGKPLDVKSSERAGKTATVAPPEEIEAPEPEVVEEKRTKDTGSRPPEQTATPSAPTGRAGGVRGFFALPPPPDGGNGGGSARPSPARSTAGGGSGGQSSSQRRRKGKKKRKR